MYSTTNLLNHLAPSVKLMMQTWAISYN